MLIDLSREVGSYLHDVFIAKFQWWVLLGYVAQIMFTMRFVVQWIASERAGTSNYGMWDRLWIGILDLLGVWWLIRRRRRVPDVSEVKRHAD